MSSETDIADDRIPSGMVYRNGWRVIYGARKITRGKNKGKVEATYRKSATVYRKVIVGQNEIKDLPHGREEE